MKNKTIPFLIYLYISLPFLIFAVGFLKPYIGLPVGAVIILSMLLAAKADELQNVIERNNLPKLFIGLAVILLIVLLSGIGGVFWQNNDHATRNTLFNILVSQKWPPINEAGDRALIYYIGFWMPSALIGKLISLPAGYIFQIIWAFLGIGIVWYLICSLRGKFSLFPLFVFLFFSGMDIIGYEIAVNFFSVSKLQLGQWCSVDNLLFTNHIEWWPKYFQYSSHLTQLFWVFNQALPVWIATLLLLNEKHNKNNVFIMGVTLLSSALPFIGLIPIFIWCAVTKFDVPLERSVTKEPIVDFLDMFTFQNLLGGGLSGIISFLYLRGNIASSKTGAISNSEANESLLDFLPLFIIAVAFFVVIYITFMHQSRYSIFCLIPLIMAAYMFSTVNEARRLYYILFIILELVIISALLYPRFKNSSLFKIVFLSLLVIPFFKVGKSIDFCMRACIPALCVLSLFAIFALSDYKTQGKKLLFTALLVVLVCGAITPSFEIARTALKTVTNMQKFGHVGNDTKTVDSVMGSGNFTGMTEDNVFYQYLAK